MAIGHIGAWGLPDLGISEFIGDLAGKKRDPVTGGSQVFSGGTSQSPVYTPPPTNNSGGGGSSGGGGARPSGQSSQGTPTGQTNSPTDTARKYEEDVNRQKADEEARIRALQEQQRNAISSSFEPIFNELDRQIGMLPEQRKAYETQIASLAETQVTGAESERERGVNTLTSAKGEEAKRAKTSIRDLEQDIRNQLEAKATYFGNLGAGDSSAIDQVSEAVTKAGLKSKSTVLAGRDQAMATIDAKIGDVNNLASTELRKIDEWKSTKLFEIGQTFTNQLNQLNSAKANASAEKQKAISDIIFGLEQQFMGRLQELDDSVINYKSSINSWQMQREAELQDYATKLGMSATYSGGANNQKAYDNARKIFDFGIESGLTEYEARQAAIAQAGVDPFEGAAIDLGDDIKKKEGILSGIGNFVTGVLSGGGAN